MKRRHELIENVCQRGSVYIVRHNFRQRFVEKNKSQGGTVVAWGLVMQLPSADNADHTVAVIREALVWSAPLSTSTNNNMNTQHHVTVVTWGLVTQLPSADNADQTMKSLSLKCADCRICIVYYKYILKCNWTRESRQQLAVTTSLKSQRGYRTTKTLRAYLADVMNFRS